MLAHAASDHGSVDNVQGSKERGRAVAFVIVRHGPALAGLQRQAWLCAVERLDLTLLVDGDDDRMSWRVHVWRVHVESDDILDLLGEFRIAGALERADTMRLEAMRLPQALDGAKRNANGLGHGAAGPMGGFARRFGTGQLQNFGDDFGRERRPAGLARLVAQEAVDALLAVSPLPAPDCGAAYAGAARDFQNRQALGGKQNDLRTLDMLQRAVSITNDASRRSRSSAEMITLTIRPCRQLHKSGGTCESYVSVSALEYFPIRLRRIRRPRNNFGNRLA